ncbi:MAG: methyl-accepting chemotaxis protein [Psychromonas sp.]|nr:methyl-accepting chemotaxis protein [Psychromonas sp.]
MAMPVALVSILFVVILFKVWLAFNEQERSNFKLTQEVLPALADMNDGYRDLYQVIAAAQAIALSKDDPKVVKQQKFEFNDNAPRARKRLNVAQRLIDNHFINRSKQDDLNRLNESFDKWLSLYNELFSLNTGFASHYQRNKKEIDLQFKVIHNSLKNITNAIEENSENLDKHQLAAMQSTKIIMEVGALVAIVVSGFLTWYLSGVIVAPIKRLNRAMKDISSGDGDLTARVNVESEDEIGQLAKSFNLFVEKIHSTISEVIGASQEVRHEVENIGKVTNSISGGASEQQRESDAVATAVHEMSATSETVSDNANEAASASQSASDEASNAKLVLGDTVTSIQSLSTEIAQAGEVINTLEHDVKDISSILDVIRGIAEQTNLLALNAAIEAARAGEQGRGFAVVADEVRSLASKTQDSTGEIQNMIEKLQNGAQQAVKVMTSSQTNSKETVQQADIAGHSLDAIVGAINVINDMNIQIATAATQQSQVSENVNINVQHIAENSHQVVGMVSDAEHARTALDVQCGKLDNLVAQFKV